MRREYDFSQGTRGKHAGKRLRIVGDKDIRNKPNTKGKMANNLVGTAGEYYVCAELCRLGYLALLTPKKIPYSMWWRLTWTVQHPCLYK